MAYRFLSASTFVEFAIAPLNGYTSGPLTFAALVKLNTTGIGQTFFSFTTSALALIARCSLQSANQQRVLLPGQVDVAATVPGTPTWALVAITKPGTSTTPRGHIHNGTSWAHTNAGGTVTSFALGATDKIRVGVADGVNSHLEADVVCMGLKKSDSTDLAIETLSRTLFTAWLAFGFDWLVGFETIAAVQDQASPGTGDETSRAGSITLVTDAPGWTWPAAAATFVPQVAIL